MKSKKRIASEKKELLTVLISHHADEKLRESQLRLRHHFLKLGKKRSELTLSNIIETLIMKNDLNSLFDETMDYDTITVCKNDEEEAGTGYDPTIREEEP